MAVRIRMTRTGRKNRPFWRIGVFESTTRRDGQALELIGAYDPRVNDPLRKVSLDKPRYEHWVQHGALATEKVRMLLKNAGLL